MRGASAFPLAAFTVFLIATPVRAQVCAGFPSLVDRPFQIGGNATSSLDAGSGAISFTAGKRVFGTLGLGTTHFERLDYWSLDLNLGAGYEVPLVQSHGVSICPLAAFAAGFGPNNVNGTPYDLGTVGLSFGLSAGGVMASGSQLAVIPSAFFRVARTKTTMDIPGQPDETLSRVTYVVVGGSVGISLGRALTLRPAVSFPLGLDERGHPDVPARQPSSRAFSLTLAIHLGRPAS